LLIFYDLFLIFVEYTNYSTDRHKYCTIKFRSYKNFVHPKLTSWNL